MDIKEMSENATKLGILDALIDLYQRYGFGVELKAGMEIAVDRLKELSKSLDSEGQQKNDT